MDRLTRFAIAACAMVVFAPPPARADDAAKTVRFSGFAHEPIGDATIVHAGSHLQVAHLGGSGGDGVRIHLGDGVSALRVRARVTNETALPPGAFIQISSCAGSATDSVGFLRVQRMAAGGYEVSGGVAGASDQWVSAYRGGTLVHRDPVAATGNPFARVPACLACGSNLNDELSRASDIVLRWQWSKPLPVALLREGGADTTVVADELRLSAPSRDRAALLSDFYVRGRDVGELRIDSETATRRRAGRPKP